MFCTKCGAQLAEGSKFCTSCGAQIGDAAPAAPQAPTFQAAPESPADSVFAAASVSFAATKKRKPLPIIIAAAVVVIAVILIIVLTGGKGGSNSVKGVIGSYFTAFEKDDEKAISKLIMPEMKKAYLTFAGGDEDDLLEDFDYYSDLYGSKVKSWEIEDEETASKSEIKELESMLTIVGSKAKIQEGKAVTVEADIKGEGEYEIEFILVKTGGKWYIAALD